MKTLILALGIATATLGATATASAHEPGRYGNSSRGYYQQRGGYNQSRYGGYNYQPRSSGYNYQPGYSYSPYSSYGYSGYRYAPSYRYAPNYNYGYQPGVSLWLNFGR